MGIISVENTDRLYWLGRYSERVYTTIKLFADSYDDMIDYYFDSYAEFCRRLDIPNIYDSRETFIARYCFDPDDPDSIHANLIRAYDNCVVLREAIGSETVSYIQLAMYDMNRARASQAPLVELQKVTDNILAFWGIADDSIDSENVRNLIKVGKRVERLDLYARLRMPVPEMQREFHRLAGRIGRTCLKYNEARRFGLPYVVLHTPRPFDTTTLNYNWQIWETNAFSIYTTNTARVDKASAKQAVDAILNFMADQGVIRYQGCGGYLSRVIESEDFVPVRAENAGFFDAHVAPGEEVARGQLLARIWDPYLGVELSALHAPVHGTVAFVHDEDMTYESTAVLKLIRSPAWNDL